MASASKDQSKRKLYRRKWAPTDNPVVIEARQQTLALQRLQVWLRLAYAFISIGVLLAYWGFAQGGGLVASISGVLIAVVSFVIAMVFRVGIDHGRKNVNAMLEELESNK